jgi:phage shock protein PspC (stress-responsive transcriptional regulator)
MENDTQSDEPLPPPPAASTPPAAPPPPRLTKRKDAAWINGVAAGIAAYFHIDPLWVRIAFVVTSYFGGLGVIAYAAGMLLLPDATEEEAAAWPLDDSRTGPWVSKEWYLGPGRFIAVLIVGCAVISLAGLFGVGGGGMLLAVILICAGYYFLSDNTRLQDLRSSFVGSPGSPGSPGAPGAPGATTASPPGAGYAAAPGTRPTERSEYWTSEMAARHRERVETRRAERREGRLLRRMTIGLAFLVVGVLIAIDRTDSYAIEPHVFFASALLVMSLGIIVSAWRGRAGALVVLALLLTPMTIGSTAANDAIDDGTGQERWEPSSAAAMLTSYTHGAGDAVLDLSNVRLSTGEVRDVEVNLGMGRLRILIPEGTGYDIDANVTLGDIEYFGAEVDDEDRDESRHTSATGTGTLRIDAKVGMGQLDVENVPAASTTTITELPSTTPSITDSTTTDNPTTSTTGALR